MDLRSRRALHARTSNLSHTWLLRLHARPAASRTKVSIRVNHLGTVLDTTGSVVYSSVNVGMGIAFTALDAPAHAAVEKWLAMLRGN